jgi:hypothetical protein
VRETHAAKPQLRFLIDIKNTDNTGANNDNAAIFAMMRIPVSSIDIIIDFITVK